MSKFKYVKCEICGHTSHKKLLNSKICFSCRCLQNAVLGIVVYFFGKSSPYNRQSRRYWLKRFQTVFPEAEFDFSKEQIIWRRGYGSEVDSSE